MTHNETRKQLLDHVESQIENVENHDDLHELDVLDVKAELTLSGHLSDVTLVTSTGGPHIEINLTTRHVVGYSSGEEIRLPIRENHDVVDAAEDFYRRQFEHVDMEN